jgi:hypothetical protein
MKLYMPDVFKSDFFLIAGITPILRKAKIMILHPKTKSKIPAGREKYGLILNLICGNSGAMNNGPTVMKTNNF